MIATAAGQRRLNTALDCMQSSSLPWPHLLAFPRSVVVLALSVSRTNMVCASRSSARSVGRALRASCIAAGRLGFGQRDPGLASAGFGGLALRAGFPRCLSSGGLRGRGGLGLRCWSARLRWERRMQSNCAFKPTAEDGLWLNRLPRAAAA